MDDADPAPIAARRSPDAEPDEAPQDPWERYGWVMGAIWLVFLAFPVISSVQAEWSTPWRAASVASILAFGTVYVIAFMRLDQLDTWDDVHRYGCARLAVLMALCVLPAIVIGPAALGMLPFLVAFSMFSLYLRWALVVSALAIVATVVVPALLGLLGELWFFVLIVTLVFVTTCLVRVLDERGSQQRELARQVLIVSERERVARDVHDVLGHSLTVVTVKSELARRLVDADPERAKAELEDINALTRTALAEIRATVAGLRVARIDVELEAARVALDGAGIEAALPDDHSVVDPRHRLVLAWVLREAVTNVVRHSGAERCSVTLHTAGIVVQDDGIGCSDLAAGNGLRGLRERVSQSGGTLSVQSPEDSPGTRLEVRL